jgi:hypothetical protein
VLIGVIIEVSSRVNSHVNRVKRAALLIDVACLANYLTPKTEIVRSSETSVNFYWTTRRHIPTVSLADSVIPTKHYGDI